MTVEEKLAHIFRSLSEAGIEALVMGGHAVRYYGVGRNTVDFDFVTAVATPDELRVRLPQIHALLPLREEPVWRSGDFARYEIGKLPDGREQWLEFWLRNHLLDDFASLKSRAEMGEYGGERIAFLGLIDLLRSKETERESDWQDIELLEEILDDRNRAMISRPGGLLTFLSSLRSRRGMDFAVERGLVSDPEIVTKVLSACSHPVTAAFLYPFASGQPLPHLLAGSSSTVQSLLSGSPGGSPKHFAAIEVVRLGYRRAAIDRDRADKQLQLRKQKSTPTFPPSPRID